MLYFISTRFHCEDIRHTQCIHHPQILLFVKVIFFCRLWARAQKAAGKVHTKNLINSWKGEHNTKREIIEFECCECLSSSSHSLRYLFSSRVNIIKKPNHSLIWIPFSCYQLLWNIQQRGFIKDFNSILIRLIYLRFSSLPNHERAMGGRWRILDSFFHQRSIFHV